MQKFWLIIVTIAVVVLASYFVLSYLSDDVCQPVYAVKATADGNVEYDVRATEWESDGVDEDGDGVADELEVEGRIVVCDDGAVRYYVE